MLVCWLDGLEIKLGMKNAGLVKKLLKEVAFWTFSILNFLDPFYRLSIWENTLPEE